MNEAVWLTCTNPSSMLGFLQGKASDRKLRLFSCACCRRVWHLLHKRGRKAVTIAEGFADGTVEASKLEHAQGRLILNAYWLAIPLAIPKYLSGAPQQAAYQAADAVRHAVANNADANRCLRSVVEARVIEDEEQHPLRVQLELLRLLLDVIGNPFRPITIDPGIFAWNDRTVPKIAQAIYQDGNFSDLPILADALEDAGCDEEDILEHCREPGDHVRGCWVVDLLLRKE